jgi:predicted nucleotide-binding protein
MLGNDRLRNGQHAEEFRTEDFKRLSEQIWSADLVDAALRFGGLDRPRVFLGSCSKAHDLASAIRWYVESLGFKVIYWKSDFEPGQVILDEIRAASFSCKYAMFLLTPDDQIAGDDPTWVPRDNVVFEAGYFINALGKERTLIIVQEGTKVLADYGGHISIPLSKKADVSSIAPDLRRFLSSDLPQRNAASGQSNAATG